MSDDRRSFLKKTGLVASALALTGVNAQKKDEEMRVQPTVKKVRALGFQWQTLDPFLFCVHHEDKYPEGNGSLGPKASLAGRNIGQDFILKDGWRMYHGQDVPGFPGHPHRGFETITVVRDGYVDHFDSMNGKARYGHGDVQWMTAGKGILHSEMFPLVHEDKGNRMELFQIWLNLPKKNKMVDPYFRMNWSEDIQIIEKEDENGNAYKLELLFGKWGSAEAETSTPDSWAANPENEVGIYAIKMDSNVTFKIPPTRGDINRTIYFFEGQELLVGDTKVPHYHAADVQSDQELVIKNGTTAGQILILQGKPIGEPVVQHGPFVMNTKEEIQEAFSDYQRTQFGGWPLDHYDPTHGKKPKRFAQHADGTREER